MAIEASPSGFKYAAFISYSHTDRAVADKLHRAIERYTVPKRLQGLPGRDGPIPARIFPVFRDREELPSSADLNDQIKTALEQSAVLIVICSPRAAASRWVNEEILTFKRIGRSDRILAVIVDGEPNTADKPGADAAAECFPPALRYRAGPGGGLTNERVEPVAADARPEGDGEENARLKVIAGILGIGFGQLKQRDLEAQRRRLQKLAAISGSIAIVLAGLTVLSLYFARKARDERSVALRHLGDSYAARAADLAADGLDDMAVRLALFGWRVSEGTSTRAADVLRLAGARLNVEVRFPINSQLYSRGHLSPDQRFIVTADQNDATVFDAISGDVVRALRGHTAPLRSARFSPDGAQVLTGSEDGTARLWNVADGRPLATLGQPGSALWFAEFWRDGSAIVTATFDGDITVWNARDYSQITAMNTRGAAGALVEGADASSLSIGGGIESIDLSSDGRRILALTRMFAPVLFVLDDGNRAEMLLVGGMRGVRQARFSPDSRYIGLISSEGRLRVGDAHTFELLLDEPAAPIFGTFAFSQDSRVIAFATSEGNLRFVDLLSRQSRTLAVEDAGSIRAMAFSSDAKVFAVGRDRGGVDIWDLESEALVATLLGHVGQITAVEFTRDARVLSTSLDGTVRRWRWRDPIPAPLLSIPLNTQFLSSVVAAGDRMLFAADERLLIVDTKTRAQREWKMEARIAVMTPSPDGLRVYVADEANTATIHGLADGRDVTLEFGVEAEHGPASWSPDGSTLVAAGGPGGAVIWDAASGKLLRQIKPTTGKDVIAAQFARGGANLFVLDAEGRLAAWTRDGRHLFAIGSDVDSHSVFEVSSLGDVLTGGLDGELRIWDGHTGALKGALAGHGRSVLGGHIVSVRFSDDGRYAASKGGDETGRVWDVQALREVRTFDLELTEGCIGFLPGSREVVVGDGDALPSVFSIATGERLATVPGGSECPVFGADRRVAAAARGSAELWDMSRLALSHQELVNATCASTGLPTSARTFTRAEADLISLIQGVRLDAAGAEVDACTGRAAPGRIR